MSQVPVSQALVALANIIVAAAAACVKKYLAVASTDRGECFCVISGITARVFTSRPIHARSQCELEKVRAVPKPRAETRRKSTKGFRVSKGGGSTVILGVWAQKLV